MKPKHTPGPWNVVVRRTNETTIDYRLLGGPIDANSEAAANARLIAAAPELLEALELSLELFTEAFNRIPIASGHATQAKIIDHNNKVGDLLARVRGGK